jgi:hypothetical protein
MASHFSWLDTGRPDVSRLLVAMLQARDALKRRSWSHPQEPTGEEWWADVLADPRARRIARIAPSRGAITIYRLCDEPHATILVVCNKCDWRAAFSRDGLIAQHGANCPMPELLGLVAAPPLPLLLRKFQSAMGTRGTHTSVGRYPDGTPNSLWPLGQATPVRTVDFDYVEIVVGSTVTRSTSSSRRRRPSLAQ